MKVLVLTLIILFIGSGVIQTINGINTPRLLGEDTTKVVSMQTNFYKNNFNVNVTITFSEDDFLFGYLMGYDTVNLRDCGHLGEIGKPMLPVKNLMVALPDSMKAINVGNIKVTKQQMDGTFTIFPVQPPQSIGTSMDVTQFVYPNMQIYNSNNPYPSQLIELTGQTDLAGQAMVRVTICPMIYTPNKKELTMINSISFVIEGVDGYKCGDYLPESISKNGRKTYEKMIKDMVINPEDVG